MQDRKNLSKWIAGTVFAPLIFGIVFSRLSFISPGQMSGIFQLVASRVFVFIGGDPYLRVGGSPTMALQNYLLAVVSLYALIFWAIYIIAKFVWWLQFDEKLPKELVKEGFLNCLKWSTPFIALTLFSYVASIYPRANFDQNVDVITPYITAEQRNILKSEWAQIKTGHDYELVQGKIDEYLKLVH